MINVINIKTTGTKDFIYIGRENKTYGMEESPAANPFRVGYGEDRWPREQSIKLFADHMQCEFQGEETDLNDGFINWMVDMCVHYQNGEDITLGCWCKPQDCHGDVIKEEIEKRWWLWLDFYGEGSVGLKGFREDGVPEFSNFHNLNVPVVMDGIEFDTTENAFQAAKTENRDEQLKFVHITPGQAKRMGRKIKLRHDWDAVKFGTMLWLVKQKFERNPELAKILLSTGDKAIVEGNKWNDDFWGIPVGKVGANRLGLILTMVRHQLRGGGMGKGVFVFGSNLAGRHGKGAALCAKNEHGAIYGQGVGLQGNSYAIPTKDEKLKTLPLNIIKKYVDQFIEFASSHPEMRFNVTRVGCGLAGYKDEDIAPMFSPRPTNVILPEEWRNMKKKYAFECREDLGEVVVAVVGSRSLNCEKCAQDAYRVWKEVYPLYPERGLVSGGADGPDSWAEDWAKEINRPIHVIRPDWKKYGKSAGFVRNKQIIEESHVVLVFWDGKSRGTEHDIKLAKEMGKDLLIYVWKEDLGKFVEKTEDKPSGPNGGGILSRGEQLRLDIEGNTDKLYNILSGRDLPAGMRLGKTPTCNCMNCKHVIENDEGVMLRCKIGKGVYNPKLDTYNSLPGEFLMNFINPFTGEDASEDEVRNIENTEETEQRLIQHSLGHHEDGMVKNTIKSMYNYYLYCSRLPFIYLGFGEGQRKIDNSEFCPWHQFNMMLSKGKCNQDLVDAFLRGPSNFVSRIPKFRKGSVNEITEMLVPPRQGGIASHIGYIKKQKKGEEYIEGREFEDLTPVWVPFERMNKLWESLFINAKGKDFYKDMIDRMWEEGIPYGVAKRTAWNMLRKYTPEWMMKVAEHNTDWKRIPHPVDPTVLRDARSALIKNGMEVKKAYKLTHSQVFAAYRKLVSEASRPAQDMVETELEKDERLADMIGIDACTGKGTVITPEMHQKYTEGKRKTFYVVQTTGQTMLAVDWNQLPEVERRAYLGDSIYEDQFKFVAGETTLADAEGCEEAFIEWAVENANRANKLETEYIDAMRGLNDESLLKAMTIKLHMLTRGGGTGHCTKCGKKLAKLNDGAFCFNCAGEYERSAKSRMIDKIVCEEVHA